MTLVGKQVGPYRILREIGRGGVGVVYLAQHVDLGRHDAVKILLPEYAGDERLTRVIMDDAKIAASLSHPNIVTVYTIGVHEGRPYFAMELLEGEWLDQRIKRSPLDPQTAARVMREVSQALDHAHMHNVVHLDVKPNNIFVGGKNRQLKLTDFGIARHFRDDQRTHHGGMVGTPAYMAPEQFDDKIGRIGPPADVYSLGVVLFEMLTGKQPFQAENHWGIVRQHLKEVRPRPSRLRPALGGTFDRPVTKAMAVAPGQRYKRAVDFAVEVAKAANVTTVRKSPTPDWRMMAAAISAVAIIGIVVLAALSADGRGDPPRVPTNTTSSLATANGNIATIATSPSVDDGLVQSHIYSMIATDTPIAAVLFDIVPTPTRSIVDLIPTDTNVAGNIELSVQVSERGCIHIEWQPARSSDQVRACFGATCAPMEGIFVGDGGFWWDPSKLLWGRPDLEGSSGTYRFQVAATDGELSNVVSFEWSGGSCDPTQSDRDHSATSTPRR